MKLTTGKIPGPRKFLFYGPEGVGKTTLAADAPNPVIIDVEGGSKDLDVPRWTFPDGRVTPDTFDEVLGAVKSLAAEEHDLKTVIIDTIGSLEKMLWDELVEAGSGKKSARNQGGKRVESIDEFDFGKGHNATLSRMRELFSSLERLASKRAMNVIILSHSEITLYKNPETDDYDRFSMNLHKKLSKFIQGWCDVVGYVSYEDGGGKLHTRDKRARGWSTGRRLVRLAHSAAFDAKSRLAMPDVVELSTEAPWQPFKDAMEVGDASPDQLRRSIMVECKRIDDDDLTGKVTTACEGDVRSGILLQYLINLKNRPAVEAVEEVTTNG